MSAMKYLAGLIEDAGLTPEEAAALDLAAWPEEMLAFVVDRTPPGKTPLHPLRPDPEQEGEDF